MHQDVSKILYTQDQIAARVAQLGQRISDDYGQQGVLLVSVLKGSFVFAADLARALTIPCQVDFMAVSSYGSAAVSSGELRIQKDLSLPVEGRHVLVVEDILDSGFTLSELVPLLQSRGAASVRVAAFLKKEGAQKYQVPCEYVGFSCPDEFVVGYGLDYAENYRGLPYVGVLKPSVYE